MKTFLSPVTSPAVQLPYLKQSAIVLFLLLSSLFTYSQELIKDINRSENGMMNEYKEAADVNGVLYYTSGSELWKTSGTRASSFRVKQFKGLHTLTSALGKLYFVANDGTGDELWKSDGTNAGTLKVKDIWPGPNGSLPEKLTVMDAHLYFVANDGVHGKELWKTDGTSAGTVLVKDILPRLGGGNPAYLANVNGILFFSASNASEGNELWKSDGTTTGTMMVRDIKPGSKVSSFPRHITGVNGVVYFSADDSESGRELWKTNGTAEGTVKIRDIVPGAMGTNMLNFTAVDNILFFSANDRIHGEELWKSDGTSSGTVMVKDLTPGSKGSSYRDAFSHQFTGLKNINGTLYFTAYRNDSYYNWKSDGTEAGTIPFHHAGSLGIEQINSNFTWFNNNVFFYSGSGYDVTLELLKEDASGTVTRASFLYLNGYYTSLNQLLVKSGNFLYLTGRKSPSSGYALFRSDGTTAGLQQVIDNVSLKNLSSSPTNFLKIGDIVYFTTTILNSEGYTTSFALWSTDGTTAGTSFVFNLTYDVVSLLNIDGTLHIVDYKDGRVEVFRSDGTTAGTRVLPTPRPADAAYLKSLAHTNGKYFLIWSANFHGTPDHLWTADGTTSTPVHTFSEGSWRGFNQLVVLNNIVYFQASESGTGSELWRSDGSESGTYLVKDILPGDQGSFPYNVTAFKNNLYFAANNGVNGYELWRSDGTASGTFMLKDISTTNGDAGYGRPEKFLEVNDQLYFTFQDQTDCWLWKTDGTSSGTTLMKKVDGIHTMMNGTDQLYFLSYSSTNKLWSSKGSPVTTQLVKDLGPEASVGSHIMIGPVLYMNGNNTTYRSDGTECGTFELDMPLNGAHSEYMNYPGIEAIDNDLIFGAYRKDIGQELFKINTADISVPVCEEALASLMSIDQTAYFPNPFVSEFSLKVDGPVGGFFNVQIFDLNNVLIDSEGGLQYNNKYVLGTSLRKGSYVLKINEEGKSSVRRIIKN